MHDKEFDALIESVKKPVDAHVEQVARKSLFGDKEQFKFANDNDGPWPLIPFPDGWYGAC